MEDLTKSQLVLLLILVSVVVALTTAIVTVALVAQTPEGITQTIQRVVERAVPGGEGEGEIVRIVTEENRVIEVVEKVSPAVVSVVATKDLPVLEECFVTPFFIPQLCQRGTQEQQVSAGSGFFVNQNGLLVTNRHVVADTEASYTVVMNDGRRLAARVLARDPLEDIALLDVEGDNFPALTLGDSTKLRTGQTVIAIGNALGEFQNTISVGVISGLRRSLIASGEELRSVIQTDAAINPGNSGGPLLGLDGAVVGINTAVAARAENIGFALPVNVVKRDIENFEKSGRIIYPFLGVRYQMITPELRNQKGLSVSEGALIVGSVEEPGVTPNSPAHRAGVREGDIIIEIAGRRLTRDHTLADIIRGLHVGEEVSLAVLRGGEEVHLKATLAERAL